jgi:hypothetical protein
LDTLKSLSLFNIRNIYLAEENSSKLKKLDITDTSLSRPVEQKTMIIFPAIEELVLDNFNPIFEKYKSIIDYNSIKKLKKLSANISDFNDLNFEYLEKVIIVASRKELSLDNERKMLEKIISIKKLIEIDIPLKNIDDTELSELSEIKEVNNSIEKLNIKMYNEQEKLTLNILQNIFPNLSSLNIQLSSKSDNIYYDLDIQENPNSKINQFCIEGIGKTNINFNIKSLENLTKIDIDSNIKEFPPIFYKKEKVIFKSLTYFRLNVRGNKIKMDVIKNICKSIDNMPNLKDFKINCLLESSDVSDIQFLKDCFVKKLLKLKLNSIEFMIKTDKDCLDIEYTIKELKDNYHIINCCDLFNIKIKKFN